MSLLTRNTILTAKIEGSYGTDPTPTTVADYIAAHNISFSPEIARNDPPRTGASMSPVAGTRGIGHSGISFDYEVQIVSGDDDFSAAMIALLKACGWGASAGTYTPKTGDSSSAYDSATLWVYKDGIAWKPTGCRGDVKFTCRPGEPFLANFTMQGLYKEPADVAFPASVTDTGTHTLVAMGGAFTIDSYTAVCRSLEFGLGYDMSPRPTIGAASPALQGVAGIGLTGRKPTVTVVVEAVLAATQDYFADFAATGDRGTCQIALSYVMTDPGSNTTCTITMPKLEIANIVPNDDSGYVTYTITATPVRDLETGTLDYDSGGTTTPTIGETITGASSGRVGTLASYTTDTGSWAGGDAAGTMTLTSLSGPIVYTNDEALTGSTSGADMATANGVGTSDNIGEDEISIALAAA